MGWLKKTFCFHMNWSSGKPVGDFSQSIEEWQGLRPYHCVECEKVKYYKFGESPINYDITQK